MVYYPAGMTADGAGVVSRNLDYTTGNAEWKKPRPGELPIYSRPFLKTFVNAFMRLPSCRRAAEPRAHSGGGREKVRLQVCRYW